MRKFRNVQIVGEPASAVRKMTISLFIDRNAAKFGRVGDRLLRFKGGLSLLEMVDDVVLEALGEVLIAVADDAREVILSKVEALLRSRLSNLLDADQIEAIVTEVRGLDIAVE